jgi:Tfp pilus assembly protein PilN
LIDSEPLLTVPIGLALAGRPLDGAARRMSLLPTEVAVVRQRRRQSALVAAAVMVLAALLLVVYVGRRSQVSSARDKAERAEAETAALRQDAARLSQVTTVDTQLQERRAMVETALTGDVAWTRLLQEVATVLPNDVWLTGFTGQRGGTATGPAVPGQSTEGTINVTGQGFDQSSAARWLLRVGELRSLTGLWLPSSTKSGEGTNATITFTSTANLTPEARAGNDRRDRYFGGTG